MTDYLDDLMKSLTTLGPEALTVCVMIALGYVLRLVPKFPNAWIPVACILGAPCIYPFLTSPGRVSPDVQHPIVRIILTGFLIGFLAWILHDKVLAHIEDKVPFLKGLLARADASGSKRYRKAADGSFEEVVTGNPTKGNEP